MNRRNFLKSLAVACGAVIVCPGELLKGPVASPVYMIELPWKAYHNGSHFKSEAEYKEFLEKFKTAFKNTKFKPPHKGLTKIYESNKPGIGERSKHMYLAGVWI